MTAETRANQQELLYSNVYSDEYKALGDIFGGDLGFGCPIAASFFDNSWGELPKVTISFNPRGQISDIVCEGEIGFRDLVFSRHTLNYSCQQCPLVKKSRYYYNFPGSK